MIQPYVAPKQAEVDFPDYDAEEFPECLPKEIWASFDGQGEFMAAFTEPPYMRGGVCAHYILEKVVPA